MVKKKKSVKKKSSGGSSSSNRDLTIHFMPYSEIVNESSLARIKKIIGLVLENRIIILQGKLTPEEETKLIENTMTLVGNLKGFQGIEIATISNNSDTRTLFEKVRHNIAKILVGEHDAITLIGPATIVKEIKRDPKKIELMLKRR